MMSLKELFDTFAAEMNLDLMLAQTETLWRKELGQRYRDHRRAALYAESLCRKAGLSRVERIVFPADGKTVFQDKTSPLAWDASLGRLTVVKSPAPFEDPVVADYARHPFHLVRGSVATPKGGTTTRLFTEEQMFGGCDVRGAMVVFNAETRVRGTVLQALCDMGAIGFVTDQIKDRYLTPDGICWVNGCSEGPQWHVLDDDRPFIGFSVAPRIGDALRAAARAGEVMVKVESNARRYVGEVDLVTAVVPGRDRRELWLLSHLYEPLPDDNSAGTIASIETARALMRLVAAGRLPPPRFTLRLVFGLEMYGFAAYAHRRGGRLRNRVIGALNMDGLPVSPKGGKLVLAAAGSPFPGDYVMEELFQACRNEKGMALKRIEEHGGYMDDMFLGDSTTGVPTIWPLGDFDLWHNSEQRMNVIDRDCFRTAAAFNAAWTARMLTLEGETLRAQLAAASELAREHLDREADALRRRLSAGELDLRQARKMIGWRLDWETGRLAALGRYDDGRSARKAISALRAASRRHLASFPVDKKAKSPERSLWERIAATITPRRATVGFPYDLRRAPKDERRSMPDGIIYGPFARVMANMDGRKTLEELAHESAWESGVPLKPSTLREYIGAVEFLSDCGYLRTRYLRPVRRADIAAALRRVGVRRGDLLMLHSGLAGLGHVEGGPDAVIDACLDVLGKDGTLLTPAFSRSEICVGGSPLRAKLFRPYHPRKSRPWVGRIPACFLKRPGVLRSAHPTHSVAAFGPLAEACLRDHRENDPLVPRHGPFGKLVDHGGKMVWLGADLASTTFFHLLEDEARVPYLGESLCQIERPDGTRETVHVPNYLPGHRDFYGAPGEKSKAYRRLIADGLRIRRAPLGFAQVKMIDARQMYELGTAALRDDPDLFLCDSPACAFCATHRSRKQTR